MTGAFLSLGALALMFVGFALVATGATTTMIRASTAGSLAVAGKELLRGAVTMAVGAAVALLGVILMVSAPASAQTAEGGSVTRCAPYQRVVDELSSAYGESRDSVGLSRHEMIEIWRSNATGTWSILIVDAEGTACLVAAGVDYQELREPAPPVGEEM